MTISRLELIDVAPSDYPEVTFRTVCSTGTYVRTLADDIARALGGRAHLTALRRIRNGPLNVVDGYTVADVEAEVSSGTWGRLVLDPWTALAPMATLQVDEAGAFRVRNGSRLSGPSEDADGLVRVGDRNGALLAVYRREGDVLTPEVVLP